MKWFQALCTGFILFYLIILFVSARSIFTKPYDVSYWKERYEHSQWQLPLSHHTLGDDGLYSYIGYRLLQGDDPSLANAEVPPLGKYFIGISILLFRNASIYGFITMTLTVVLFFFLAQAITKDRGVALITTALFITDPLVTRQFTLSMPDSAQLLFLLIYFFLLTKVFSVKSSTLPLVTIILGITLGLLSQIKFPLLSPVLFAIGLYVLLQIRKSPRSGILFSVAVVIGYLLPFTNYFLKGHSFIEFMKLQKWIISFYASSGLQPNIGSIWTTLLTGNYRDLFSHVFTHSAEWSPIWPLVTLLGCIFFIRGVLKKNSANVVKIIGLFTLIGLCVFSFIPFWTRYLLLFIPFLYVGSIIVFRSLPKGKYPLFILLVSINLFSTIPIIFPTPKDTAHQFLYDWSQGYGKDMYEHMTPEAQSLSRDAFNEKVQTLMYDAQIETADISTPPATQWGLFPSVQSVPVHITYHLRNLGDYAFTTTVTFKRHENTWAVDWGWENFFPDLTQEARIQTSVTPAKRGAIYKQSRVLTQDSPSYMLSITPNKIQAQQEQEMLEFLSGLFDTRLKQVHIHERYINHYLPHLAIPIGVLPTPPDQQTVQKLNSYSGISLTPSFTRTSLNSTHIESGTVMNTHFSECCSLLYNTTTYDGNGDEEEIYNVTLKGFNGGSLEILDQNGHLLHTLLQVTKKEGRDKIL